VNLVFEYIKYRWKAKGRHGTHSPFIYKMVDECFKISIKQEDKNLIQSLISQLKNDKRSIRFSDFGAGSKKLKTERKISSVLKNSSSKGKYANLFYQLSKFYQPLQILEFGTSLGIGTIHFAKGNPNAKITTVEACPETAKIASENFEKIGVQNIQLLNKTFENFLKEEDIAVYDLVFIDGHHDGIALLRYVDLLDKYTHEDTFIILDDIRWSDSMFSSWNKLKDDKRFNVSIDLFRMGVLLKRSGQKKEHFTVRL
jgi:predicted O-methyltransferase YrrM